MNSNQDSSANQAEDPPENLDQRLEKLDARLGQHREIRGDEEEKKAGLNDNAGFAYGLKIASEFVSAILVGCVIGWVIDQWLETTPFGLILFLILGFAAGVLNVMRATGQIAHPGAKKR